MKERYEPEDLEELVAYMESCGIRFSSKRFEQNNRYAIMGSKTSVRILEDARDGINGNRINARYHKEVFPNSEATRPYKISITEDELDGVIKLLLENGENL